MSSGTSLPAFRSAAVAAALVLACLLGTPGFIPSAVGNESESASQVEGLMDQAKKLDAKGRLPMAWWDLDARWKEAKEAGATPAQWDAMLVDARRLVNQADLVKRMRQQKSGMEALLRSYDQSLREIAVLYGVDPDPVLTGDGAAAALLEELTHRNLRRQVVVDSLTVLNRSLAEQVGGQDGATEALITSLQVEISSLRQKLWETELRAGVAEADRSAAETVLTSKQDREAALAKIQDVFRPEEAEVLLTPEGGALLRVFGMAFGVGSAALADGQTALVDKVVQVVQIFPEAEIKVEGHTDDTGGRQANLRLSRRRAETVARLLEERLSLDEGLIATEGFGPDRPLALNDTAAGRARNRRIDVAITEKK